MEKQNRKHHSSRQESFVLKGISKELPTQTQQNADMGLGPVIQVQGVNFEELPGRFLLSPCTEHLAGVAFIPDEAQRNAFWKM